jgi:zinc protease
MFRGTERFSQQQWSQIMKAAGAGTNAYTTDDRTVYQAVFSKEDLEQVTALESDRFENLKVPIDLFKTETKAVLGEYNKNYSNPVSKLIEVLRDTAFDVHTYKHTTMGFLRDIENMPNLYDYSIDFFRRYYRPEYTTILAVGDVGREQVAGLAGEYWGAWTRGSYVPEIPCEPQQTAERRGHVDWPTPTLPWVAVAYKGPAYSDEQKDKAALDLIGKLGFSQTSELYQRLVIREQKVDLLALWFEDSIDPNLFTIAARVKEPIHTRYVQDAIISTFKYFTDNHVSEEKLSEVKSNLKYSFALSLDDSEAIAAHLAPYLALRRNPETINKLYAIYDEITPADIQEMASRYFLDSSRTVVTLSYNTNK